MCTVIYPFHRQDLPYRCCNGLEAIRTIRTSWSAKWSERIELQGIWGKTFDKVENKNEKKTKFLPLSQSVVQGACCHFLHVKFKYDDSNLIWTVLLSITAVASWGELVKPVLGCSYIRPLIYFGVPKTPSECLMLVGTKEGRWETGPDEAWIQAEVASATCMLHSIIIIFLLLTYFQ